MHLGIFTHSDIYLRCVFPNGILSTYIPELWHVCIVIEDMLWWRPIHLFWHNETSLRSHPFCLVLPFRPVPKVHKKPYNPGSYINTCGPWAADVFNDIMLACITVLPVTMVMMITTLSSLKPLPDCLNCFPFWKWFMCFCFLQHLFTNWTISTVCVWVKIFFFKFQINECHLYFLS